MLDLLLQNKKKTNKNGFIFLKVKKRNIVRNTLHLENQVIRSIFCFSNENLYNFIEEEIF